jgi:hypothetical protein
MRGPRGIDVVENVQRFSTLQNTVDGGLGYGDLVHSALLVAGRMMTYPRGEERSFAAGPVVRCRGNGRSIGRQTIFRA